MDKYEAKIAMSQSLANLAMQLYVADIQKCPVDKLPDIRPLNRVRSEGYVKEAVHIWADALLTVESVMEKQTTMKKK